MHCSMYSLTELLAWPLVLFKSNFYLNDSLKNKISWAVMISFCDLTNTKKYGPKMLILSYCIGFWCIFKITWFQTAFDCITLRQNYIDLCEQWAVVFFESEYTFTPENSQNRFQFSTFCKGALLFKWAYYKGLRYLVLNNINTSKHLTTPPKTEASKAFNTFLIQSQQKFNTTSCTVLSEVHVIHAYTFTQSLTNIYNVISCNPIFTVLPACEVVPLSLPASVITETRNKN